MWDTEEIEHNDETPEIGIQALSGLILLIASLAGLVGPALAQTPTPNQINAIAKELWCPLCNGVRLDNCELQACVQMKEVIAQKLTAGEGKAQIKAYFVQQYGDVVLGRSASEGFNALVWLLPIPGWHRGNRLVGVVAAFLDAQTEAGTGCQPRCCRSCVLFGSPCTRRISIPIICVMVGLHRK